MPQSNDGAWRPPKKDADFMRVQGKKQTRIRILVDKMPGRGFAKLSDKFLTSFTQSYTHFNRV